MKKLKSEKGAITIIVLVSVLFFVSFLISSYVIVANKVQAQKEMIEETKKIYEPKSSIEDIYNSYFSSDEVIPIYTVEQLLLIGEEDKQISIDGKYYTFTNTSSYILKNDLEFSAIDLELTTDWIAIGSEASTFKGNFEGNGHIITVTNLDGSIKIYSEDNNYGKSLGKWRIAEIKPEGWSNKVIAMTDGTEILPLPDGFNISSKEGEDEIESGLVIADKNGNEFVWIPVENTVIDISDKIKTIDTITANYGASNSWKLVKDAISEQVDLTSGIYPMVAKIGEVGEEHYIGISYSFDESGNISSLAILNGGTLYAEPRVITGQHAYKTGTQNDAIYSNILMAMTNEEISQMTINENSTTEECATYFCNKLQNDFDEMAKSAIKYSGFYVGRYETSGFNTETVKIKVEEKYGDRSQTWYTMYKKQKEFSSSIPENSVGSNMIWGCQYDQVMNFVNGKTDGNMETYNVGTTGARTSGDKDAGTGYMLVDKVANIFDLEGCRYEWTAEIDTTNGRVIRGGKYDTNNASANRNRYSPGLNSYSRSRIILYMK